MFLEVQGFRVDKIKLMRYNKRVVAHLGYVSIGWRKRAEERRISVEKMEIRVVRDGVEKTEEVILEQTMQAESDSETRRHFIGEGPEGRLVYLLRQRPEGELDELITYRRAKLGIRRVDAVVADKIEIVVAAA